MRKVLESITICCVAQVVLAVLPSAALGQYDAPIVWITADRGIYPLVYDAQGGRPLQIDPSNYPDEQAALLEFIQTYARETHVDALAYRADQHIFKRVLPSEPCSVLGGGNWPVPADQVQDPLVTFGPDNESWLFDLAPFANQGSKPVQLFWRPERLTHPFDRRLCREDNDVKGSLAGGDGAAGCKFSYMNVILYLRDQLNHVYNEAEAIEPGLFHKIVRGVHLNFESNSFPRFAYSELPWDPAIGVEDKRYPRRREGLPGVCLGTADAFRTVDFDGVGGADHPLAGYVNGVPGDLEDFFRDIEFDYPELMIDESGAAVDTYHLFGTAVTSYGYSRAFTISDDRVSRVELLLQRTDEEYVGSHLYYTLTATNGDGTPYLAGGRTRPRALRKDWIPHADDVDKDWVSLYVDPEESMSLFEAGELVAILVYAVIDSSERTHEIGATSGGDGRSYRVQTNGSADVQLVGSPSSLDHVTQHRVWYATDPGAHADWVTYQNRSVGAVMRDINEIALNKSSGGPGEVLRYVELWPFMQDPEVFKRGVEGREWYGSDWNENYQGIGTAAQIGGINHGYVGSLRDALRVNDEYVQPKIYQITNDSDHPFWISEKIHDSSKWAFVFGGAAVFNGNDAYWATSADFEQWRAENYPRIGAYTAPVVAFGEHYERANAGASADSTIVVGPGGHEFYVLRNHCPAPECVGQNGVGYLLVANDDPDFPGTVDTGDPAVVPTGWRRTSHRETIREDVVDLVIDEFETYVQEAHSSSVVPVVRDTICCDETLPSVLLQRRGNPDLRSVLVGRYVTPLHSDQPGVVDSDTPSGVYCTDEVVQVEWTPVPQPCIEQLGIVGVDVYVDLEVQIDIYGEPDPWVVYASQAFAEDPGGVAYFDLCGESPPDFECNQWYGRPWRARVTIDVEFEEEAGDDPGEVYYGLQEWMSRTGTQFTVYNELSSSCAPGGGCPYVGTTTADGHVLDNNVLAYSGDGSTVTDHYRMRVTPDLIDGSYYFTISEEMDDASEFDDIDVLVLEHPSSTRVAISHDGVVYAHESIRPLVKGEDDEDVDVTELLEAEDDTLYFHGYAGDAVIMDLGVVDSTSALHIVSDIKHEISSIDVQVKEPQGPWVTVATIEPRDKWGEDVIDLATLGATPGEELTVRFSWTDEHKLDFVGMLEGVGTVTSIELPLASAHHTTRGDVTSELTSTDGMTVPLVSDDIVLLEYEADSVASGMVRDFVFVAHGAWTGEASTEARTGMGATPAVVPSLRLLGPRPRPGPVTMKLRLPGHGDARVQIFDLQGRLVRTLVDERLRAGDHILSWNLRDDGAREVGAGVYFARMQALGTGEVQKIHVLR